MTRASESRRRDKPIIFSAPMVRALLDARKTQTRRLLKPQPPEWATFCEQPTMLNILHQWVPSGLWRWQEEVQPAFSRIPRAWPVDGDGQHYWLRPRFARQDRLWVRENGCLTKLRAPEDLGSPGLFRHDVPATADLGHFWIERTRQAGASYLPAGCSRSAHLLSASTKACPSIHMPRWASRLTLTVTDVRVQRLQEISEDDAVAEGSGQYASSTKLCAAFDPSRKGSYREGFRELWGNLHGPEAWAANPWVVALTFMVEQRNIDALREAA